MRRKGRINIVTIISSILVLIGVIVSLFMEDVNEFVTMITTITAVIGAFAIYVQIRKSKLIGQSSFTIEMSKYLYEIEEISDLIHKLGKADVVENKQYVITEKDKPATLKYLNYLKTIATLVNSKVVNIETINDVFAYEFFIIVNNKSVQDQEIRPYSMFYQDLFMLYKKWQDFRLKEGTSIVGKETNLELIPEYQEFLKGGRK